MEPIRQSTLLGGAPNYRYGRLHLLYIRHLSASQPKRTEVLATLKANGILRYRGVRAGRAKSRCIKTITGVGHKRFQRSRSPRETFLVSVAIQASKSIGVTAGSVPDSLPGIYIINASSIAKPHAIDQLKAELCGYGLDLAIITETHLKAKHKDSISMDFLSSVAIDYVG